MKNEFDHKDFESFLRQNARQFRMFPTEKVWKHIEKTLHPRRKWYAGALVLLLLSVGSVMYFMMRNTGKIITSAKEVAVASPAEEQSKSQPAAVPVILVKHNNGSLNLTPVNFSVSSADDNIMTSVPGQVIPGLGTDKAKIDLADASSVPVTKPGNIQTILPSFLKATPDENIADARSTERNTTAPVPVHLLTNPDSKILSSFNKPFPDSRNEISPFTIESIANEYQAIKLKKRWSWEVYFTPTVSYRKLSENKAFINSATAQLTNYTPPSSGYLSIAGIKDLVMHKPDMGVQLGFRTGYHLTKRIKLIGGLQFNVSKYDIRASYSQPVVATIALRSGNGVGALSTVTNLRNLDNAQSNWLRNLYFSAAAPVGAEVKLFSGKTDIGVSGTIQPMFILNDKAYLISTDYKDYAQVPSLTRDWNISAGMEAFAGYTTGKLHWRIGPTVRYQLRSSFSNTYPVTEHIFDYGLKVGIMLNK